MHADRLLRLADYLETVVAKLPPEQFHMAQWGIRDPDCGTACCAVGHAAAIPEFRAAGLSLEWETGDAEPVFGDCFGWRAVCKFFGLAFIEAEPLFSPTYYFDCDGREVPANEITPGMVAARIRDYVGVPHVTLKL